MKYPTRAGVTVGLLLVCAAGFTALSLDTAPARPRGATSAAPAPALPIGQPPTADDAVQRALRAGKPTVAEFGANACAQCREMKPVLAALRREHGERIAVVDVDLIAQREHNYIQRYGIQLMPTQIFFDVQGREIGRHLGPLSAAAILARLRVTAAPTPPAPATADTKAGGTS